MIRIINACSVHTWLWYSSINHIKRTVVPLLVLAVLTFSLVSCSTFLQKDKSPEATKGKAARIELKHLLIPFKPENFISYARAGDTSKVSLFLTAGMGPDTRDSDGTTALMWAAWGGHIETARLLLDHGADVNAQDKNNRTALMFAAGGGHTETVEALLRRGANVNVKNEQGWTALLYAAQGSSRDETVKVLLDNGADPNAKGDNDETALMTAAGIGRIETVKMLLEKSADVNAKSKYGRTALDYAAGGGHANIVEVLLEKGADITEKNGPRALLSAAARGNIDIVRALLDKGVNVNAKNESGKTALMLAAQSGRSEVLKYLIEKGADVNVKDNDGETALISAAMFGQTEPIDILLESDADINAESKYSTVRLQEGNPRDPLNIMFLIGGRALMWAAFHRHSGTVKVLLDRGADVNAKDAYGRTALMLAAFQGHIDTLRVLLDNGADINAQGNFHVSIFKEGARGGPDTGIALRNATALMVATLMGRTETVKLLLERGADVNAAADDETTALLLAQERGHREIVHLLQMAGASLLGRSDRTTKYQVDFYCPSENQRAWAAYDRAGQHVEKEELEEAKRFYLKAIDLDPKFCDAMDNLGLIFRRLGDINQAIYWYRKSVDTFFYNPVPHSNLAVVYSMQGKFTEALEEYKMVVKIDPDNPEGFYGLGFTYIYLKQPQDAVTPLKKAEELYNKRLSPLVSHAQVGLGLAYHDLGDCPKARSYLKGVYEENKENPLVNLYLGECYTTQELRDFKKAREYVRKAQLLGMKIPDELARKVSCEADIKKPRPNYKIILDESLQKMDLRVSATWLVYAGARAYWLECKYWEQKPMVGIYHYTFSEELDAREQMLIFWASTKSENSNIVDEYLDQLLRVKNAGFLREYVWSYLRVPEWVEKPDGLKQAEFSQWQNVYLLGHEPKTRAILKLEGLED